MKLVARAPGKVNLSLFLGPVRSDGRHELVTLFESVSLADSIELTGAPADADEVVCPGVPGPNIVGRALVGLREGGWGAPPVRIAIRKRIPVAGGMGGGSADAAAVLRMAPALGPVSEAVVGAIATSLGADVPSQLAPGVSIGTGAGEVVSPVDPLGPHAFVIVPQAFGLSTADVFREADRLGLPRGTDELTGRLRELRAALGSGAPLPPELLVNDLEPGAISLRPEIGRALDAVRELSAACAVVSGSGPTVFGLFHGPDAPARAETAARYLLDRYPEATSAAPVSEEFGAPRGS